MDDDLLDCTSFDDISASLNALAEMTIQKCTYVTASQCGLDRRAAQGLFRGEDYLVVTKSDDARLLYYGGFEYVDKSCRMEFGDYVFYSTEDERVRCHWEQSETEEDKS